MSFCLVVTREGALRADGGQLFIDANILFIEHNYLQSTLPPPWSWSHEACRGLVLERRAQAHQTPPPHPSGSCAHQPTFHPYLLDIQSLFVSVNELNTKQ